MNGRKLSLISTKDEQLGNLELISKLQHVSSTSIQCFNLIHCIEFSEAFLNIGSLNNIGILEN